MECFVEDQYGDLIPLEEWELQIRCEELDEIIENHLWGTNIELFVATLDPDLIQHLDDHHPDFVEDRTLDITNGKGCFSEGDDDWYDAMCSILPGELIFFEDLPNGSNLLFSTEETFTSPCSVYYCIIDWTKYVWQSKPNVRKSLKKQKKHFKDMSTPELLLFKRALLNPLNIPRIVDQLGAISSNFSVESLSLAV